MPLPGSRRTQSERSRRRLQYACIPPILELRKIRPLGARQDARAQELVDKKVSIGNSMKVQE